MRNWDEIIKQAKNQGHITAQEAENLCGEYELLKEGSLRSGLGALGGYVRRKSTKFLTGVKKKENLGLIFLAATGLPVAAEVGSKIIAPLKHQLAYGSMKKQLARIAPQILKEHDDEYIRNVYGMVRTVAPIITSNPALAAIAVRDGIDVPQTFSAGILANLARIQKDAVSGQIGQKAKQVSENITGVATKAINLVSGIASADQTISGM